MSPGERMRGRMVTVLGFRVAAPGSIPEGGCFFYLLFQFSPLVRSRTLSSELGTNVLRAERFTPIVPEIHVAKKVLHLADRGQSRPSARSCYFANIDACYANLLVFSFGHRFAPLNV